MSDTALVDTGFWIALFDPRDEHHESAGEREDLLELVTLIVPWPILYETLRTRFVRRPEWVLRLDQLLKKPNVEFVDDQDYREEAYSRIVGHSRRSRRGLSMVDMLCRQLIADPNIHINYLLTTNPEDFVDVCIKYNVELL